MAIDPATGQGGTTQKCHLANSGFHGYDASLIMDEQWKLVDEQWLPWL